MATSNNNNSDYIISYLLLRQFIGVLGISLPFGLLIGNKLLGSPVWLQPSISHYYYSYMHIAFVGVLCVLGGFLISYKGKNNYENRVSNFAGAFSFGVAIFPTNCLGYVGKDYVYNAVWHEWFNYIHFGSAGLLFACFALFCLRIFQESDAGVVVAQFDAKKKRRNTIYSTCGWGIVASILMIVACTVYEKIYQPNAFTTYATFLFETTALLFFGNSWLLKGSVNWKTSGNSILERMATPVR